MSRSFSGVNAGGGEMKKAVIITMVLVAFIAGFNTKAFSRDDYGFYPHYAAHYQVINRPVNIQGLTGLILTNSAYTQPAGSVVFGISGQGEDSDTPNYSVAQGAATITIGVTDRVEVAIKGRTIGTGLGSSTDRSIGPGDTDLLLKWRFSSQGENLPALAFGFGWTFPTGDSDNGFTEIKYEGIKLMVIASSENRVLSDGFLGIYMEAQAVLNDQLHKREESPYKEKYGVVNAGILFPISDDNHLQFLFEYSRVVKRNFTVLYDRNYTGLMPGLRYVTDNFNISLGIQRINREDSGPAADSKANRLMGTMNYRF